MAKDKPWPVEPVRRAMEGRPVPTDDPQAVANTAQAQMEAQLDQRASRKTLADQGLASLIVPKGLHELISGAAQAGGLTHPELIGMYEAEIRDLLAGRLQREWLDEDGVHGAPIPSLLDRLKQRAHEELKQKLGELLEPVAGK